MAAQHCAFSRIRQSLAAEAPVRFLMMSDFQIIERTPSVEEFISLRKAVGWHVPAERAVSSALKNSLFSVCILKNGKCVGCGRVVGDGSLVFHLQDVIVLPEYQRQGYGTHIMDALMGYIARNAQPTAFIALFSAPVVESWYNRYGFISRPTDNLGPGMAFFME